MSRDFEGLSIHTGWKRIQSTVWAQVIHKERALHCRNCPIILYLDLTDILHIVFWRVRCGIRLGSGYACKVWSPNTHIRLPEPMRTLAGCALEKNRLWLSTIQPGFPLKVFLPNRYHVDTGAPDRAEKYEANLVPGSQSGFQDSP